MISLSIFRPRRVTQVAQPHDWWLQPWLACGHLRQRKAGAPRRSRGWLAAAMVTAWLASGCTQLAWGQEADPIATTNDAAPAGLLQIVFSGGWVGLLIILVLLGLSLTAAYLAFEQIMTLRRRELLPQGLAEAVRQQIMQGRLKEAAQTCQQKPSMLSFVLLSGLSEADGDWAGVEKAMEDALAEQSAGLYRKIEYLSVIGNLAPMVGLLGTVIGMIFAFQQVAATQGTAGAGELAEGIYQALVTTVGGLLIAIPALGVFAVFRNWVDQLTAEAAYAAQHGLAPLKRRASAPPPIKGA